MQFLVTEYRRRYRIRGWQDASDRRSVLLPVTPRYSATYGPRPPARRRLRGLHARVVRHLLKVMGQRLGLERQGREWATLIS